jgi:hypothetical protein
MTIEGECRYICGGCRVGATIKVPYEEGSNFKEVMVAASKNHHDDASPSCRSPRIMITVKFHRTTNEQSV